MQNKKAMIGAALFLLLALIFFGAIFYGNINNTEYISYNSFIQYINTQQVKEVVISESPKIQFTLKQSDKTYTTDNPRNLELKEQLLLKDIAVVEAKAGEAGNIVQGVITMVFFGIGIFFVYRLTGKNSVKSAMALNVSDVSGQEKSVLSFKDIAGNEEAKDSVEDIIDFIKNPEKYSKYGARLPRGVIFYGPPGTGKTMMAKAVAGEGGVPFFAVSGSDFVQMYVGVGANRIRELFKKARSVGKAVIFIDEIDALGKKRTSSAGGGSDERDQTLNALLTEMSGFSSHDGVVVIAATNRLDTLDDALLRPGRFDRHVEISLPDLNARIRILNYHSKSKPLSAEIDLKKLAQETVYFSGAMLENLLNEGAIYAAKDEKSFILKEHLEKAYYTIIAGKEKADRSNIMEKEKMITAYHEAGHGLTAHFAAPENTVSKITIIPSSKGAGGFCINIPPEKMYYTKKELEAQIMVSLGGRAAEEIVFGRENITTGASNDIEKATSIVKDYVMKYGMGDNNGVLNINLFSTTAQPIEECGKILEELYNKTKELLKENRELLNLLAQSLIEKETLTYEDLKTIFNAE